MRFIDFLKTAVLLSMAAATMLATFTVLASSEDRPLLLGLAGWWLVAGLLGAVLGRRRHTSPPIARLLAGARATTTLPEVRPGPVLLGRLWPLLASTAAGALLAFLGPQVPGIAAGFAVLGSLLWRHQDAAVAAIEDRDGVAFFVEPGSPFQAMSLVRTPSFRRETPMVASDGAA
ncbi:MAG TPA: hypothetical protein VGV40_05605 [Solirubrobacteraceae bacterium]|nr:hypothetical protein [Solirubrobacteraceae bacterium]